MKPRLYWSYATRSLLRGGQRSILAIFCVTVGVMAIVALQLVGLSVNQALLSNIVEANGGDIRLTASVAPLRPRDLSIFDQLKQQGSITDYATAYTTGGSITLPSGEETTFSLTAVSSNFPLAGPLRFLAPANASPQLIQGNSVAVSERVFQALKAHIGSSYRVKTFDGRLVPVTIAGEFQESGSFRGAQLLISQTTLAAIPNANGTTQPTQYGTIYLTVPSAQINQVKTQLSQHFPTARITTAQDLLKQRQTEVDQIQLFLHIVGLLALFIGGIGIINTMQVLLHRRRIEIAMLKTTGYRRSDLYGLFGLEAALLGTLGGTIGTAAGVGASYVVRTVTDQTFQVHLPIVLDPLTICSGLLIGLATALIFGLLPIVQASQIRPLAVLREQPEGLRTTSRATMLALLALLSLLFVALSTTILGDLPTALIAVYGGAGIIFALGLGLGLLLVAISRLPVYERPNPRILLWILAALGGVILALLAGGLLFLLGESANRFAAHLGNSSIGIYLLAVPGGLGVILIGSSLVYFLATLLDGLSMFAPRAWKTALMLAYRNLGRQRVRTTTTLTALFVGVFAIGLVLILGQGVKETITNTLSTLFTRNVFVVIPSRQQESVTAQIPHLPGLDGSKTVVNTLVPQIYPLFISGRDLNTVIQSIHSQDKISKEGLLNSLGNIEGFHLQLGGNNVPTITLKAGRNLDQRDAGTNHIVVSARLQTAPIRLQVGDTVIVQSTDGSVTQELQIVGFYDNTDPTGNPNFAALLADSQVVARLGGSSTLTVFSLKVDPDQLPSMKRDLNSTVPAAIVISIVDIDTIINQVLNNVIIMLTTIASLAMLASLIIIANAVALAMLERQREIGILKAVGHTSRSVLATVLIENGLIGLLASLVAMLLVAGSITVLSQFVFQIPLTVTPALIALIIAATVATTMLMALLVCWRAVRIRPLEVLRYE